MKRKKKKNDQKNFKKGGVDAKEIKNYKEKKTTLDDDYY